MGPILGAIKQPNVYVGDGKAGDNSNSSLRAGSQWGTPKAHTPRITRAKASNRRSTAHPFATSGPSGSFHATGSSREREVAHHRSQKSFHKLLANSSKTIASLTNVHGGGVTVDGQNVHARDNKWLEGVYGSSATFVETFMCLWGLWREKVEAGTAAEMHQVALPPACVPEWLGAPLYSLLLAKIHAYLRLWRFE